MGHRLRLVAAMLGLIGLGFLTAGAVAYNRTAQGAEALQAFSAAQNVNLSYNDAGELTDRGTTEGADAILMLLEGDWGYPVDHSHLDPADPLVNTPTEYMYQLATITYHVLHGTQQVTLAEAVEYNGERFDPGTYDVPVNGRYWTDFDRRHPLDGPARGQAWSGTVHGLVGELGVGTVTHTSIQMGYAMAGGFAGIGLIALLAGLGLYLMTKQAASTTILDGAQAEERQTVYH